MTKNHRDFFLSIKNVEPINGYTCSIVSNLCISWKELVSMICNSSFVNLKLNAFSIMLVSSSDTYALNFHRISTSVRQISKFFVPFSSIRVISKFLSSNDDMMNQIWTISRDTYVKCLAISIILRIDQTKNCSKISEKYRYPSLLSLSFELRIVLFVFFTKRVLQSTAYCISVGTGFSTRSLLSVKKKKKIRTRKEVERIEAGHRHSFY